MLYVKFQLLMLKCRDMYDARGGSSSRGVKAAARVAEQGSAHAHLRPSSLIDKHWIRDRPPKCSIVGHGRSVGIGPWHFFRVPHLTSEPSEQASVCLWAEGDQWAERAVSDIPEQMVSVEAPVCHRVAECVSYVRESCELSG